MHRLRKGDGKERILIDLMNSSEARALQKHLINSENGIDNLMTELKQLEKKNKKSWLLKTFSMTNSIDRKINSFEFRLEMSMSVMLDDFRNQITEQLEHRFELNAYKEGIVKGDRMMTVVQTHRRNISRPAGEQ